MLHLDCPSVLACFSVGKIVAFLVIGCGIGFPLIFDIAFCACCWMYFLTFYIITYWLRVWNLSADFFWNKIIPE